MNRIIFILFLFLSNCYLINKTPEKNNNLVVLALLSLNNTSYNWNLPQGFPTPIVPNENPMTEAKVNLGRFLFYEKKLSNNQTQSCASCHIQSIAFSDGIAVGVGSTGEFHPRNSQQLVNVAYLPKLTWSNNNLNTIEQQVRLPLFGDNPIELGISGETATNRLKADSRYTDLFNKAFGGTIDEQNIRYALSAFSRTLISGNSAYDKYVTQKIPSAMTASQIRGMNIFNGEVAECFHCHGGFNFSDSTTHTGAVLNVTQYHDNGNKSTTEYNALSENKRGLYELTKKTSDIGRFRAPSLRNIALTYPYMHDGSFDCSPANKGTLGVYSDACATEALGKVIDHYTSGGKTPSNKDTGFIRPFSLTTGERTDLINFLKSLTDEDFLKNQKFSSPF